MMQLRKKIINCILIFAMLSALIGCSAGKQGNEEQSQSGTNSKDLTVIGFSQVGAESTWRTTNSESMKRAFTEENGYRLIFEDGQQKQSNQIMAIRKFIQQEVDYIVLAPVTETGWDTVLMEAKDAGIPVIIVDRMVDVEDDSLYQCWVGSNVYLEGQRMCAWINDYCKAKNIDVNNLNIVNIQGTIGATAEIGRTRGLQEASSQYRWNLLRKVPGDFTKTKGREVMKDLLSQYKTINIVYCENDEMAIGAIEEIEASGKKVGSNIRAGQIMVVSFDGVSEEAKQLVREGKISCIAECNPLHGPRVRTIIEKLENGENLPKLQYVNEEMYAHDDTVKKVEVQGVYYPITVLDSSNTVDSGLQIMSKPENN